MTFKHPLHSVGMDPDVHGCAFAYITEQLDGTLDLKVAVVRQKAGTRRDAALALIKQDAFGCAVHCPEEDAYFPEILTVEGQDVRYTGKTNANPQDVLNLALISGAAIGESVADAIYCPLPREWKGTVKKVIKQKRILSGLGIEYEMRGGKDPYPVPVNFKQYGNVNAGDWKDLTDAVGLAVWGLEKFKKEQGLCLK